MNVFDVTPVIRFVPQQVFPIAMLPKGLLLFGRPWLVALERFPVGRVSAA